MTRCREAERVSRVIVLTSMLAAGAADAFFASQTEAAAPWAAALAFTLSFALARVSLPLGLLPALLLAYASPAVMSVVFKTPDDHSLIWLALLAGPILAAGQWSQWHTLATWTPWIAGWGLVIAISWPVIAGREVDFSLAAARTLTTPNGLNAGAPPVAAAAVAAAAFAHLVTICWFDLLWARFGAERVARAERLILVPVALSVAIGSVVALYQRYVDIEWLANDRFAVYGRASGLMLDANSSGMAAAIWAPLAFIVFKRLRQPAIGVLVTLLLFGGVWATGSRTAFVVAGLGIFVLVAQLLAAGSWRNRIVLVAALGVGAAVFALAPGVGDHSSPLARIREMRAYKENLEIATALRALWNRNGYGIAAGEAIARHPWTGVGIGAFNQMSSDFSYLAIGAVLPPDNAQNWWRQQIAELGVLGAVPGLMLSVLVLSSIFRGKAEADRRQAAIVTRTVVSAVGLISLVGVPTQHPALLMTFATILYWMTSLIGRSNAGPTATWLNRGAWSAAFVLPVLLVMGQWQSAVGDLRVPHRAVRLGFPYAYGFTAYESDSVPWTGRHAVAVLLVQHAYFALTADPSHIGQPVRVRLWRGGDLIADVQSSAQDKIVRIIRVPENQRYMMIEIDVSAVAPDGRGLRMTSEWLREVPVGTGAGLVVP